MAFMRKLSRIVSVFLAFLTLFTVAFNTPVFAEDPDNGERLYQIGENRTAYVHDPSDNPEAMKDIVKDETAVYGFRPSETGSLKAYADADWSDPAVVEKGRQERIAYHNSIESMYDMLRQMRNEGKDVEDIARSLSAKRNELRMESFKDDPEGLETLKQRNLEKYGHEEGPLPDELYSQYGSWEIVIEKAFSANVGMDACLGLYDDYYDLYVVLGQVEDDAISKNVATPQTGDNGHLGVWIVLTFTSGIAFAALLFRYKRKSQFYDLTVRISPN